MNVPLIHHTVTFPDCRLQFDYPADLKPSADFVMQKMATVVDYGTIRWVSPNASDAFILMRSDLRGHFWQGAIATLSIEMWLGATPEKYAGDIFNPEGLKSAFVDICAIENDRVNRESLHEKKIHNRRWIVASESGIYLTALNQKIILAVRVSATSNQNERQKWTDLLSRTKSVVLESLIIDGAK